MPGTAYSISTIQSLLQPIFDSYKKSENPFFSVRMQRETLQKRVNARITPTRQIQIYGGVFEVVLQEKLSQIC